MSKNLQELFQELGLIVDDRSNSVDSFSWQNSHASRLDVARFVHQQPHWRSTKPVEEVKHKKIILNSYYFFPPINPDEWNILTFLSDQNFEIYTRTGPCEIKQLAPTEFSLLKSQLCDTIDLQNELLTQGEDIKEYVVIDDNKLLELHEKLQEYVYLNGYNYDNRRDQLVLRRSLSVFDLTDAHINSILATQKNYKTIRFDLNNSFFIWDNNFTQGELLELLTSIHDRNNHEYTFLKELFASRLRTLNIQNTDTNIMDVSFFKNLKELQLGKMDGLRQIIGIEELSSLEQLLLSYCSIPTELPDLPQLKELIIEGEVKIDDLEKLLKQCPNLETLTIANCKSLIELDLTNLPHLKNLTIQHCHELTKINGLNNLPIEKLNYTGNSAIINFNELPHLRLLEIDWSCDVSTNYRTHGLKHCTNLEEIHFKAFTFTRDNHPTLDLGNFSQLKKVEIIDLPDLANILGIEKCQNLEHLKLHNVGIASMDLSANSALQKIAISQCSNLTTLDGLDKCKNITDSTIVNCKNLSTGVKASPTAYKWHRDVQFYTYQRPPKQKFEIPIGISEKISITNNSSLPSLSKSSQTTLGLNSYASAPEKTTGLAFDTETYTDPNKPNEVIKKFTNLSNPSKEPHVSDYRDVTYDYLELNDDDEIILHEADPFADLEPYTLPLNKNTPEDIYLGAITAQLSPGDQQVLSGLSAQDKLLDVYDADKLDIFHNKNTHQYIVGLKPGAKFSSYSLRYLINKDENYHHHSDLTDLNTANCPPLPQKLFDSLRQYFNQNPDHPFVYKLQHAKDDVERLRTIIDYCKYEFENKAFKNTVGNDVSGLIKVIDKARGACRHRSIVAMALCHYFGIPARVNRNDCHAFIEVPVGYPDIKWQGFNLGGSASRLVVKNNLYLDKNLLNSKLPIPSQNTNPPQSNTPAASPASQPKPLATPITPQNANSTQPIQTSASNNPLPPAPPDYHVYFWDDRSWLNTIKNLDDFNSRVTAVAKPTLIRINQKEDAWNWHITLNNHLSRNAQSSVYIDNADELKTLFETVKIEDGDEKTVDGPIRKLIARGKGTPIVNWSNFDPTERVIYKSMMDDPPTLNGVPIPKDVHLVGLLPRNMTANDVFMSRSEEIPVPRQINKPNGSIYPNRDWLTEIKPNHDKTLIVNLYHSTDWSKLLVEDLSIDGDQLISKPGPLVQAMQLGLPIIIQNAPFEDAAFCRFWHQFTTENEIMVNGEALTYKPGFKVFLEAKNQVTVPPFIVMDETVNNTGKRYYITHENFSNLFELQYVDDEHRIRNKKSWLQKYKTGDQFIIKDSLSSDQWQRIYDTLTTMGLKNTDQVHFYQDQPKQKTLASTEIDVIDNWLDDYRKNPTHIFLESEDVHFTAKLFKDYLKLPTNNIFHLSDEDFWPTFIENIRLYRVDKKIRADDKHLPLLNKLQAGETVILCGELKDSEFSAIETLFYDPPFLMVNGKKRTLPGKLILINKPNAKIKGVKKHHYKPDLEAYEQQLRKEINHFDGKIFANIKSFLEHCSGLETHNPKYPNPVNYGYEKIKSIYSYVDDQPWEQNPVKAILSYHYRKDSEQYAFLNVMAKYHLSKNTDIYVDKDKLLKLIDQASIDRESSHYFWRMVNCMSAMAIRYYLPFIEINGKSPDGTPALSDDSKEKLKNFFSDFRHTPQSWLYKPVSNHRYQKQISQLKNAIQDPRKRFIYLTGESGTGKTYTAKLAAKELGIKKLYVGEDDIKRWLTHPEECNLLLLDEVNFAKLGKWEFLRGLKTGKIYYDGEYYPITTQKVIATGNGLHYNLRNFHPIIWDDAHVIWFGAFEPKFIEEQIRHYCQPLMKELSPAEFSELAAIIIKSYEHLKNNKQHAAEITLRDVENICTRLIYMVHLHKQNGFSVQDLSLQAIYDEMSGIFFDAKGQEAFKGFLITNGGGSWIEPQPQNLPTKDLAVIPPSKATIWRLIEDDLQLRNMRVANNTNLLGKLGTLLEGPSGIGKSTIFIAALLQHGFSLDAKDSQKRYVQITAGSLNDEKDLLAAFHDGSAVIIDELNANPNLEKLLNQLLTGVDFQNNFANKPGFIVFASQNPPRYEGVKVSSRAIVNRLHKITMEDYSVADLEYSAAAYHIPEPQKFTQDFLDEKRNHPHLNARNFFQGIKKFLKLNPKFDTPPTPKPVRATPEPLIFDPVRFLTPAVSTQEPVQSLPPETLELSRSITPELITPKVSRPLSPEPTDTGTPILTPSPLVTPKRPKIVDVPTQMSSYNLSGSPLYNSILKYFLKNPYSSNAESHNSYSSSSNAESSYQNKRPFPSLNFGFFKRPKPIPASTLDEENEMSFSPLKFRM